MAAARPLRELRKPLLRVALVGSDLLVAGAAWFLAIRDPASTLGLTLFTLGVLALQGLHRARVCSLRSLEVAGIARAVAAAALVGSIGVAGLSVDAGQAVAGGVVAFLALAASRSIFTACLRHYRKEGSIRWPTAIVGWNEEAERLLHVTRAHPEGGFQIVGVLSDAPPQGFDGEWLGEVRGGLDRLAERGVTGLLVATTALPWDRLNSFVRDALLRGFHLHISRGLHGFDRRRVLPQSLAWEPIGYVQPIRMRRWQHAAKRTIDLLVGVIGLLLTAPLLVLTALAIKLESRGPVVFRQERVGCDGRRFEVLKLRTMVADAEARLDDLEGANLRQGPLFKMAHDPRVTRVGRFLRAASLDELPQLWNVLRGEMSIVGPRPALPREAAKFDGRLLARFDVRPGVTGLWQVEARHSDSFEEYRRLDLFYVENWSLALDFAILLGTARVLIGDLWRAMTGGEDSVAVVRDDRMRTDEVNLETQGNGSRRVSERGASNGSGNDAAASDDRDASEGLPEDGSRRNESRVTFA